MANISTYLQAIMNAVYGEEVRGSIHDAISIINDVGEKVLTVGTAVTSSSSSTEGFFNESLYLNKNTWDLWKCNGSSWVSQGNIKGRGIESVTKKSTSGLVDTYEIDYDKGASTEFQVTNGNGIKSFSKTGSSGLSDIYTIVFDDESIQRIYVANGRGITSIEKTGTSGNVDTYKINYNDRTSSTFQVTNGTDGADGFSPTVSVSKTGKDTTVTITTADGPTTFHVLDGADGQGSGDMLTSVYDKNHNGIVDAAEAVPWSGVQNKPKMTASTLGIGSPDGMTTVANNDGVFTANGVAIYSTINPSGTEHGANWLKFGNTVITPSNIQLYLVYINSKPTLWSWNGTEYVEVTANSTGGLVSISQTDFDALTQAEKDNPDIYWWIINADGSVTYSYNSLSDKPSINGVELNGAMTSSMLHIGGEIPEIIPISKGGTGNNAGYIQTGRKANTSIGNQATAEGSSVTASGLQSHAEGFSTTASGQDSHAEGRTTTASGYDSHSEGNGTRASGSYSHAEGYDTTASGQGSHAGGYGTIAAKDYQTAIGKHNSNKSDTYFEVGNGSSGSNRSNAFEVYSDGHININGDLDYMYHHMRIGEEVFDSGNGDMTLDQSSYTFTNSSWTYFTLTLTKAKLQALVNAGKVLVAIKCFRIFNASTGSDSTSYVLVKEPGMNYNWNGSEYTGMTFFGRIKLKSSMSSITCNRMAINLVSFPAIFFDNIYRERAVYDLFAYFCGQLVDPDR